MSKLYRVSLLGLLPGLAIMFAAASILSPKLMWVAVAWVGLCTILMVIDYYPIWKNKKWS